MITINTNDNSYELKTTLGVAVKLEQKFKMPMNDIFGRLENADITELVSILAIAGDKINDNSFRDDLLENWDYTDLQMAVQELLINLMFSGTPEQIEKKLEKFPVSEQQKNVFREMLKLPIPTVCSTKSNLSELPIE